MREQVKQDEDSKQVSLWKQIILRTYHPQPTINSTILLYIFFGALMIIFSIVLFVINGQIIEVTQRYDNFQSCVSAGISTNGNIKTCDVSITITEKMEKPVYFFYELTNFYQNHRRYIKSKSINQLAGLETTEAALNTDCYPAVKNSDIPITLIAEQRLSSGVAGSLVQTDIAKPCGLVARSFFNDKFQLFDPSNAQIAIDETGISWSGDKGSKFKKPSSGLTGYWIDPEDEHFIVWMRTAELPDFRKNWGKINVDLNPGTYKVTVTNNYNVAPFEGTKSIVLSTSGPFGGKNMFLPITYLILGVICLLIGGFIYMKKNSLENPKHN